MNNTNGTENQRLTKSQVIYKIKVMSVNDFLDFSYEFENFINQKTLHKIFLEKYNNYVRDQNIDNLFILAESFLKSKRCDIKEIRKSLDNTIISVSFTKAPPLSKSMMFTFSEWKTFVQKFN